MIRDIRETLRNLLKERGGGEERSGFLGRCMVEKKTSSSVLPLAVPISGTANDRRSGGSMNPRFCNANIDAVSQGVHRQTHAGALAPDDPFPHHASQPYLSSNFLLTCEVLSGDSHAFVVSKCKMKTTVEEVRG